MTKNRVLCLFLETFQVKPAAMVDKAIQLFLDIVVPGRGAGENQWYGDEYPVSECKSGVTDPYEFTQFGSII